MTILFLVLCAALVAVVSALVRAKRCCSGVVDQNFLRGRVLGAKLKPLLVEPLTSSGFRMMKVGPDTRDARAG